MKQVQTDNSYFADKVFLRLNHLPVEKEITVLDCFSGNGTIWNEVKRRTDKKITILRIEKESRKGIYLKGDNLKYLAGMDLNAFDIIDLDAYGVPFKQLQIIFEQRPKSTIFVTFIQTIYVQLPIELLTYSGYTLEMIQKIPSLFFRKAMEIMTGYLAKNGVKKIFIRRKERKNYFCFKIE